ncbi:MAG TPA: hypothetical protein VGH20_17125 [Myxococcales bacterium]|jgi:hypothetical protein
MPKRSDEGGVPEEADEGTEPEQSAEDGGPLRALSFIVLLALAIEIGLFALLGRAAA